MRTMKVISTVALAMTAAAASTALAAGPTHEVSGKIERLDPGAHHLTVRSQIYRYDPSVTSMNLHRGEPVRIIYRENHGHRYIIQILPAA